MATRTSTGKRRPPSPRQDPPADPLADMVRAAGLGEAARTALVQALAHQLVEDHFAKLDQAGHAEDEGIPLRRVFIDLFTADQGGGEPTSKKGFVAELLATRPAPIGADPMRDAASGTTSRMRTCSGFVLIGGPGQGKSTLGQLACQTHRAALLLGYVSFLTTQERDVLSDFIDPVAQKDLRAPAHPSLPVRVVLPEVATWISEQQRTAPKAADDPRKLPALLRFWHSRLPESARRALSPVDLLSLLRAGPFLLVLDGLDEVPAAGARARVLSAVRELGIALAGAPGLVLATTRPQGYAGELDGLGLALQTRHLAPLTAERALVYAQRLVDARIPDGGDRAKVMDRMREASTEAATRRLMATPLQVTILAALLRKGGRPPRERWSLFKRYYEVMFAREVAKPTDVADLLNTYKEHIYNIHARAGLLLQVESESADRTEALLPRERLEAIADAVLSEEGFQGAQRPALIERIVAAAAHRLVFLVQPQEGKFGFEIRSLQEFMAAAALAQKSEAATKVRLTHVARAGGFRNVTLFLTGKLLSETGDLRDAIAGEVCPALERDTLSKSAKAGAILALEILEDGAAMSQPRRAEDLMRVALGVLDVAPNLLQIRLAELLLGEETPAHAALEPLVRDGIQARLMGESVTSRLAAWIALLTLVANEEGRPTWAVSLADRTWPQEGAAQGAIVETALDLDGGDPLLQIVGSWLVERIGASLQHFHWRTLRRLAHFGPGLREIQDGDAPIWWLLRSWQFMEWAEWPVLLRGQQVSHITCRSVRPDTAPWQHVLARLPSTPTWRAFSAVMAFGAQPSVATLAQALRDLAEHTPQDKEAVCGLASWPLRTLLETVYSAEGLRTLAERALAGQLGDAVLWERKEEEWRKGLDFNDLLAAINLEPLTRNVDSLLRAPPLLPDSWSFWGNRPRSQNRQTARFLLGYRTATTAGKKRVAGILAFGTGADLEPVLAETAPSTVKGLLLEMTGCRISVLAALIASTHVPAITLDMWARCRPHLYYWSDDEGSAGLMSVLAAMYASDPSLHGFLHLLAELAGEGPTVQIAPVLLDRARFEDPLHRADAWLLRLHSGAVHLDDIPTLLQDATAAAEREPGYLSRVILAAESGDLDPAVCDPLLATIHSSPSDFGAASQSLSSILQYLQTRPSGLDDPDTWNRLELPLPHPTTSAPAPPPAQALTAPPVHIQKLVLQNVRSLEHLPLTPAVPPPDQGQWIVLLGENGTGKTTVLRSIVLALRNLSDPQIWPKGTFAPAWRRQGANPATDTCRVVLHLAGESHPYETTIRQNGKEVFSQSPARTAAAPPPCLLWAYGCRRGSVLGGKLREVDVSDDDGPDIATLFNEGASLIHAQTWLQKLLLEASRDSDRARPIYDAVIDALKTILDVEAIDLDSESNVLVTGAGVGTRVPLAALSDGYLTMAGWLLDLLARWIARAKQAGLPIGADFPAKMTGLVLLDEIDLHLHPAWQLAVIPRVRDIFKRLSFVVTTHNPLTIVGARPEEIWILQRDAGGVRPERRTDIPATLTAAQSYARFFGIEGFFPAPVGQQLQRYGFLCGNPYRSDDDQREMEALRADLAKAGITPGWRELPRAPAAPPVPPPAPRPSKPRNRRGKAA